MINEKSIEGMAHDYIVAAIKSGKAIERKDIQTYCEMAADVKRAAKKVQADVAADAARRRF